MQHFTGAAVCSICHQSLTVMKDFEVVDSIQAHPCH